MKILTIKQKEWSLNEIRDTLSPFHTSDFARFTTYDSEKFGLKEIVQTIKQFKQKAPGRTGLTKMNYMNLLRSLLQHLTNLFNAFHSVEYLPDKLKGPK